MNASVEIPALPPRSIVLDPPLTDEEFEQMCRQSEFASLERSKEGTIQVNAPAGSMSSDGNSEINHQLRQWWKTHRRGRTFDSSAGFFLRDGSMLSPDAAYITDEQWKRLTTGERRRFLRLAPAFVMELRSESDRLSDLQLKMEAWIANGVEVGWLLDPELRQVHIYRPDAAPRIESGSQIFGSGPIEGFVLRVDEIWKCYE